ncbi:transaldolase [Bdellovibrionota bacterium FG-1]
MQPSPFQSRVKIFLDGADRKSMVEMAPNPLVRGFTTNPSLMRKSGVTDYAGFCKEILPLLKGKPVSFEVFADDFSEMKRQAKIIAGWEGTGDHIYVKIPIINSQGISSLPLVRELSQAGIKLNITAIYTLRHIWETAEAVRGGAPSIVSVFAGRIADTGRDPLPLMQAGVDICGASGPQCELLWASTREAYNIVQADQIGCKIITSPLDMIKKVTAFNKNVDEVTLDTVRTFKADAEAAGFSL